MSADPVTAGCRMIKSPAEIALLQRANDMTLAAYKAGLATLREGMTQGDLRNGEFDICLEDCLYITESGAKFFTPPGPAIDRPFA